jgi:hypothetical protein
MRRRHTQSIFIVSLISIFFLFSLGVLQPVMANPTTNLVVNGGFETGDLSTWTVEAPPQGNPSAQPVMIANSYSGSYAVAAGLVPANIAPPFGFLSSFKLSQKLPAVSTALISQVSCWVHLSMQGLTFLILNYTDGTSSQATNSFSIDWVQYSITPSVGKIVDSIIIEFTGASIDFQPAFDDVEVIVSPPQNIIPETPFGAIGAVSVMVAVCLGYVFTSRKSKIKPLSDLSIL